MSDYVGNETVGEWIATIWGKNVDDPETQAGRDKLILGMKTDDRILSVLCHIAGVNRQIADLLRRQLRRQFDNINREDPMADGFVRAMRWMREMNETSIDTSNLSNRAKRILLHDDIRTWEEVKRRWPLKGVRNCGGITRCEIAAEYRIVMGSEIEQGDDQ